MVLLRGIWRNIEELIACTAFVIMAAVTIVNVFTRYLANFTFSWAEELARYCFMWMTFFGAAICTKHGRHIVIDFLIHPLGFRARALIDIFVDASVAALMVVLIYYGGQLALLTSITTATLNIPMSYILLALPLSCCLILIRTLEAMTAQLKARFGHGGES